jgi:hypothetical protein
MKHTELYRAAKHLSKVFGTNENLTEAITRLDAAIAEAEQEPKTFFYLVATVGNTEARVDGPFDSEEARDTEARRMNTETFFEGELFRMDIAAPEEPRIAIDPYPDSFYEEVEDGKINLNA